MIAPYVFPGLKDQYQEIIQRPHNFTENLTSVIMSVCDFLEVDYRRIVGGTRKRVLVDTRKILCHEIRTRYPKVSLKEIGKLIGSRDHTSVIYSIRSYDDLLKTDTDFRAKARRVETFLNLPRK